MADYTPPTVDDFYRRFPLLDTNSPERDYQVEALLEEAQGQVDDTWLAKDYKPAILYLVAHWLTTEGGDLVDRGGAIVSESFGPMSRTYAQGTQTLDQLGSTEYGRRYLGLRNSNFPGIAVV